jgi:predicted SAM-dependent methyltransferase
VQDLYLGNDATGGFLAINGERRMNPDPNTWTKADREIAYGRHYFDGGRGGFGGYTREGYRDFQCHAVTAQKILDLKPESVLEIGASRGYVLKRLQDHGIRVAGLEVSRHAAQHTAVMEPIFLHDITETPWPVLGSYSEMIYMGSGAKKPPMDLCFSNAVLEHIPEDKIAAVLKEAGRCCARGLHGISTKADDDKTHCCLHPLSWWQERMPKGHIAVDKESLEAGPVPKVEFDGKVKINTGSFTLMFPGWVNVDVHPLQDWAAQNGFRYLQHDIRSGIPYASNYVDLIYASHFLEHLTYDEACKFLKECARVLKPNSLVRIAVPDAAKLIDGYRSATLGFYDEVNDGCAKAPDQTGKLWALLFEGHRSAWDWAALEHAFKEAGLRFWHRGFRVSGSKQMLAETCDMFPTLSIYVEGMTA